MCPKYICSKEENTDKENPRTWDSTEWSHLSKRKQFQRVWKTALHLQPLLFYHVEGSSLLNLQENLNFDHLRNSIKPPPNLNWKKEELQENLKNGKRKEREREFSPQDMDGLKQDLLATHAYLVTVQFSSLPTHLACCIVISLSEPTYVQCLPVSLQAACCF